jgi:hypothetical protein
VRGEGHERRGLGEEPHDADALEAEPARDGRAGALEDGARPELASRERARERVERLELDVRLGVDGGRGFRWTCRR